MKLKYASINSGSNGNCYYVGTPQNGVLIDVGISAKELLKRLNRLSIQPQSIKSIFISHEHIDHIRGLQKTAEILNIPVYISKGTYQNSRLIIEGKQLNFIQHDSEIEIGGLTIKAFQKVHDAAEPLSFVVKKNDTKIGVFTDIGVACDNLKSHFSQCQVVFLEANYEPEMLLQGNYPYHLKQRISGGKGHLSNHEAVSLVQQHQSPQLQHLILSHLSNENNCPKKAAAHFEAFHPEIKITVASRHEESDLFEWQQTKQKNLVISSKAKLIQGKLFV